MMDTSSQSADRPKKHGRPPFARARKLCLRVIEPGAVPGFIAALAGLWTALAGMVFPGLGLIGPWLDRGFESFEMGRGDLRQLPNGRVEQRVLTVDPNIGGSGFCMKCRRDRSLASGP
jgi:hypothetical protein